MLGCTYVQLVLVAREENNRANSRKTSARLIEGLKSATTTRQVQVQVTVDFFSIVRGCVRGVRGESVEVSPDILVLLGYECLDLKTRNACTFGRDLRYLYVRGDETIDFVCDYT